MFQDYELNLRDYWCIILKRKWIIVFIFSMVFLATIIHTNLQPALYKAVAVIKVDRLAGLGRVFPEQYFWRPPEFELSAYAEQVVSLPIIEKAVKESGLISSKESLEELDNFIRMVAGSLFVKEIEKTNMIKIEMVFPEPKKAALILNKIVEVVKLENIKQKNQQVRNVREFIESQLERVSIQLMEAEDKLKELTLAGLGGVATSTMDKITRLESRRADLLTKFTEAHPSVLEIDNQVFSLKEELQNVPKEEFEFSNFKRDLAINERLYNLLRERLQEAQIKESETIDNIILISPAVAPRIPFTPNRSQNYLFGAVVGIIFGLFVGLVVEHLDTSIGRIEDLERVTKLSVIGVIPYFVEKGKEIKQRGKKLKNIFGKKVRKEDRIEKLRSQLIFKQKETSVFLEAFRILGANVQVIFGEGNKIKRKCILISSSNPQEGKSIIAANLGIIMAQMGYKTILVDGDLRRSTIHTLFRLKKEKGVTDILTGKISLESAVKTTTDLLLGAVEQEFLLKSPWVDNFNIITSGTVFPNSPYLFNTEKMNGFLKNLREKYEVIIIDCSPVLSVSDVSIIVPKADGVLLVYRAGVTSRLALWRAKMQVENVRKGILKGIVLNNVSPEQGIDTYYYYHRGKYYQENEGTKGI